MADTDYQQEPEEPQTQEGHDEGELTEEQVETQFEAAFRRARGQEVPENDTAAQGDDSVAEGEEASDEEPVRIAGYTEGQLQELLAKAKKVDDLEQQLQGTTGKVFGKFGEVQRALQALQQRDQSQSGDQGRAAQVTADKLKRLNEEYPDIAEMLSQDLSETWGQTGQSITPEQVDELVSRRLQQSQPDVGSLVEQKVEERLLSQRHPDFREVAQSEAFQSWAQQLPQGDQEKLASSWDSNYLAAKLDEFKQRNKPRQDRQGRLRSNVQPKGAARTDPPALSDEQAFERGFKKAREG